MAPPRYVLYIVLLLCAFVGYSLAEPSWVTVENVGEKSLPGEKDYNINIFVRTTNMNATLIDIASMILLAAYATLDDPAGIPGYLLSNFWAEVPWESGWNSFSLCGAIHLYTDYYIVLGVSVNDVFFGDYLLFSVNP